MEMIPILNTRWVWNFQFALLRADIGKAIYFTVFVVDRYRDASVDAFKTVMDAKMYSWLNCLFPSLSQRYVQQFHGHCWLSAVYATQRMSDVELNICIAANEGPYIHEFIHHYIYLGFKNIFVGVNNSEDQTLLILKKIREKYPQVHIVNVDPVVRPFMQWGCYHRLFDIALECSTSRHCLIVDIDEFWIADPFPTKINNFIRSQCHFDAFSFHWVEALDDILFDKPLSRKTKYKLSPWVKSLFNYETPLSRIGVHGPILNGHERDLTVRLGDSVNVNTQESLHGVEVLGQSPNTTASSPEKGGQAWVIHRANRSEIEYSAKLFRPHANDDPNQVSLKSNRYGWEKQDSHDPLATNYIQGLIGEKELETYHQSLSQFGNSCRIKNDINESRIPFSPDQVIETINSIDISLLKRDSDIAFRAFNGTRFLNAISKRLEETSQLA